MKKIRLLLVEDHIMTRMGISLVLQKAENIELIAEAEDGAEAIDKAKELLPDIILMDIGLPTIDGIEATKKIKAFNPNIRILMFTSRDNECDVFASFKSGADGYIMKGATPEQTINAIQAVYEGTAWIDPAIARLVLSSIQSSKQDNEIEEQPVKQNNYDLTDRELEVLSLIVNGLSNSEIAEKLVIAKATAKTHVHSILQKLYVDDRTKAAVIALKEGLV
jgi:DNA-binding NarL/FixJ family response regulator